MLFTAVTSPRIFRRGLDRSGARRLSRPGSVHSIIQQMFAGVHAAAVGCRARARGARRRAWRAGRPDEGLSFMSRTADDRPMELGRLSRRWTQRDRASGLHGFRKNQRARKRPKQPDAIRYDRAAHAVQRTARGEPPAAPPRRPTRRRPSNWRPKPTASGLANASPTGGASARARAPMSRPRTSFAAVPPVSNTPTVTGPCCKTTCGTHPRESMRRLGRAIL